MGRRGLASLACLIGPARDQCLSPQPPLRQQVVVMAGQVSPATARLRRASRRARPVHMATLPTLAVYRTCQSMTAARRR
jgi:hypothetical protein